MTLYGTPTVPNAPRWQSCSAITTTTMSAARQRCSFSVVNSECAAHATAEHTIDGMNALKDEDCMKLLERRHRRHSVKMLWNKDRVGSASVTLRMRFEFCDGGKAMLLAQAIEL